MIDIDDIERMPTSKQDVYEARIGDYSIELDLSGETTQCWVSKGRFSASLECLMGEGVLHCNDHELKVPPSVIGDIENWAYRNGY